MNECEHDFSSLDGVPTNNLLHCCRCGMRKIDAERIAALRKSLDTYCVHLHRCSISPCSCGLDAALAGEKEQTLGMLRPDEANDGRTATAREENDNGASRPKPEAPQR